MIAQIYRRLRGRNHVSSRYESWEDGEWTKNIPIERVIGGPTFRNSASDHLLQMADLIAHALLKQEEEPYPRVERQGIAKTVMEKLYLSARAFHRILKLARTIADLAGADQIGLAHLAEAVQYRQRGPE